MRAWPRCRARWGSYRCERPWGHRVSEASPHRSTPARLRPVGGRVPTDPVPTEWTERFRAPVPWWRRPSVRKRARRRLVALLLALAVALVAYTILLNADAARLRQGTARIDQEAADYRLDSARLRRRVARLELQRALDEKTP